MSEDGLLMEMSPVSDTAADWGGPAASSGDGDTALYLELEGWEGPLDLLLDLARRQKVDLRQISILSLVDQYLTYIDRAEALPREPHRIAFYLYDLAGAFHAYWNLGNDRPEKRFIVSDDAALSGARLFLAEKLGQVIRNGLRVLGVAAVEEM